MKVTIGKYRTWIGPYQIASWLRFIGVPEDTYDSIGDWLGETWIQGFCEWVESVKTREIDIHIDDYDVWAMDDTLALIIVPMLEKIKGDKYGSPIVSFEDVPEYLVPNYTPKHDIDPLHFARWNWILGEMLYAFKHISVSDWECDDPDKYEEINKRVTNGLRLFGKYYRSLWT